MALDGSEQSSDTVKYAAGLLAPESEVVLLHVMSKVPEPLRDLGLNPAWHMEDKGLREWEAQRGGTQDRRIHGKGGVEHFWMRASGRMRSKWK